MIQFSEIWQSRSIQNGITYFWQIGPLQIWLERHGDEWLLAHTHVEDETVLITPDSGEKHPGREKPEDLIWERIVAAVKDDVVLLAPVMDEKPIVVGSDSPLTILPKNEALVLVNVPTNIRIYAGKDKKTMLTELPSVALSNTWFGDPTNGVLCLSLRTSAVRSTDLLLPKPNRAGCPVLIKNLSSIPLEMQKICIHTENLGIYQGRTRLWTNKVTINYQGTDKASEMRRIKGAPHMEDEEILLSDPRIPAKEGLFQKSFFYFRQLSNI